MERHTNGSDDEKFDDIIQGKGQNVVVLLQYGSEPTLYFYNQLTFNLKAALLVLEDFDGRRTSREEGATSLLCLSAPYSLLSRVGRRLHTNPAPPISSIEICIRELK